MPCLVAWIGVWLVEHMGILLDVTYCICYVFRCCLPKWQDHGHHKRIVHLAGYSDTSVNDEKALLGA